MSGRLIDDYLSPAQAAESLGFSERHVRRLAKSGLIRHYRVGGKVFFARADLEAYFRSCAVEPKGDARISGGAALRHLPAKPTA